MRPDSTSMRLKRTDCAAAEDVLDAANEGTVGTGLGSHSARFQSPSGFRTRFRLGRSIETVPSWRWPRNNTCQQSRTVSDSALRKYSWPKRGSSPKVTDCAWSVGPRHKLKS